MKNITKNITIIIIITIITIILTPATAMAATLSLSPASGTFNKSCSFTLTVELDAGGAETDGTDAILLYDPARFSATQILNGTIYSDYPGGNIDSRNGKITLSGIASSTSTFSGKGTLARINFTVLDAAQTGASAITFDFDPQNRSKTTDSNVVERGTVSDVLTSVTNGSYIVGSGTCAAISPTPIPRGTTGISTPSAYVGPSPYVPPALPPAGSEQLTYTIAIVGLVLTVLGILGLALL